MLARRAAQRPQCILQPLRQRDITLAAHDHMGMPEARTGEPEVVQPVIEPDPGDVYAQIGHVGKIRQPHPTPLLPLATDHASTRALPRPPPPNTPLPPLPHSPAPLRLQ